MYMYNVHGYVHILLVCCYSDNADLHIGIVGLWLAL